MLADPKVLKFGVGITFDADKLMTDHVLPLRGCVDLRHLVVRVRNNGLTRRGLKNIAKVWLGIEYESGKDVQCSVWDQGKILELIFCVFFSSNSSHYNPGDTF